MPATGVAANQAGDRRDDEAVRLLVGLVQIASLSRQERPAVDYLVEQFQTLGYDQAFRDDAGNAVGIRQRPDASGTIRETGILLGHIDTVPGEIPVRLEQGRLYGRGSVDAKGSLATFAVAASRAPLGLGQRWIVVGAVEEECSTSAGARFVAQAYRPDWCIIGEPSGADAVTLGYKGRLQIRANFVQSSAHSAGPRVAVAEHGVELWNAVRRWADAWNADRTMVFEQLQVSLEEFQTGSDGLQDTARLRIGMRLPVDFSPPQLAAVCGPGTGRCGSELGTTWTREQFGWEVAYQEPRSSWLVQRFNQVFRQAGLAPRHKLKTGTSDMNVVVPHWKCPIVAYGPGDSSLDHTPQEHLEIAEFLRAIARLQAVLKLTGKSDLANCGGSG